MATTSLGCNWLTSSIDPEMGQGLDRQRVCSKLPFLIHAASLTLRPPAPLKSRQSLPPPREGPHTRGCATGLDPEKFWSFWLLHLSCLTHQLACHISHHHLESLLPSMNSPQIHVPMVICDHPLGKLLDSADLSPPALTTTKLTLHNNHYLKTEGGRRSGGMQLSFQL